MYMIKWTENNEVKSIVAEGYIELESILEQKQQYNPSYELI